ncbi:hypothetical protein JMJ77_0006314, partial [Colletotrichum scovillei]
LGSVRFPKNYIVSDGVHLVALGPKGQFLCKRAHGDRSEHFEPILCGKYMSRSRRIWPFGPLSPFI